MKKPRGRAVKRGNHQYKGDYQLGRGLLERIRGNKVLKSLGDSEVLYNYTFGIKVPQSEGMVVPRISLNLATIDYSEFPLFRRTRGKVGSKALLWVYPSAKVTIAIGFRRTDQQLSLLKVGWRSIPSN